MANHGTWGISLRRYRQFFRRVANEVESFVKIWFQNYGWREEMLTACFIKMRRRKRAKSRLGSTLSNNFKWKSCPRFYFSSLQDSNGKPPRIPWRRSNISWCISDPIHHNQVAIPFPSSGREYKIPFSDLTDWVVKISVRNLRPSFFTFIKRGEKYRRENERTNKNFKWQEMRRKRFEFYYTTFRDQLSHILRLKNSFAFKFNPFCVIF